MSKAEEDFRGRQWLCQLLVRSERLPSSALPAVGLLMHVIAWRAWKLHAESAPSPNVSVDS